MVEILAIGGRSPNAFRSSDHLAGYFTLDSNLNVVGWSVLPGEHPALGQCIVEFDANGDSWPDIATAYETTNEILVWSNDQGTFSEPFRYQGLVDIEQLVATDWNEDGMSDLMVLSGSKGGRYLLAS